MGCNERLGRTHNTLPGVNRQLSGGCCKARGLSLLPCDDLEGGMGVGRAPEGGGMCGHIADLLIVQQELTQHCKATTPSI